MEDFSDHAGVVGGVNLTRQPQRHMEGRAGSDLNSRCPMKIAAIRKTSAGNNGMQMGIEIIKSSLSMVFGIIPQAG